MIDSYQKFLFDRRAALMIAGTGVLTSILVLQMINLQVFNRRRFQRLAQSNIFRVHIEIPRRGVIYAANGVELAHDEQVFRLFIIPRDMNNYEQGLEFLRVNLGLNERTMARIARTRRRQRAFQPILIREKLSWQKMAELSALNMPGIYIRQGFSRRYPFGSMASHTIGYLSEPRDSTVPFFKTGRAGLERIYNDKLMGTTGQTMNIANAEGMIIGEDRSQSFPAIAGDSLQTTINRDIQRALDTEIQRLVSGTGIVMDLETGDILAMSSYPAFNADLFGSEDGEDYMTELRNDPLKPFLNKTLDGLYSPGSVFKVVVALAGLEMGVINPRERIRCTGEWRLGNHLFHCWARHGHGMMDLHDAMARSCDVYFYVQSLKIGIDAISAMARRLGMGARVFTNYDESERPGIIPTREWKEANTGVPWVMGDTVITAIGQGFVLANNMQLAVMMGAAVTNYKVKPRLTFDKPIVREYMMLNPGNIAINNRSLEAVIFDDRGTARASRVDVNGRRMAGKTGTTQVRRISLEERISGIRRQEDLPRELRNHGIFTGFAPSNNPRYVVSIVAEHIGSGSIAARSAAAVMREVLRVKS